MIRMGKETEEGRKGEDRRGKERSEEERRGIAGPFTEPSLIATQKKE